MTSDAHYPIDKTSCLPMKVWSRCDVQVISVMKGGSHHGVGPTQEMLCGVLKLLFLRYFSHDAYWQPEAVRLWMVISAWERRGDYTKEMLCMTLTNQVSRHTPSSHSEFLPWNFGIYCPIHLEYEYPRWLVGSFSFKSHPGNMLPENLLSEHKKITVTRMKVPWITDSLIFFSFLAIQQF
jgi:hypothetical protein